MLAPDGTSLTAPGSPAGWPASSSRASGSGSATAPGRRLRARSRSRSSAATTSRRTTRSSSPPRTRFPAGWTNGTTLTVTVLRIAAFATWDDGELPNPPGDATPNWYLEQRIVLVADLLFSEPIQRQGVKIFPVSTHVLSKLQGPLAVEGGVTGADRSLNLGVKLPGEKDGPLFEIGPQPPESKQIDVLNVFNDGSQQDRTGGMTSTTIKGLGLAGRPRLRPDLLERQPADVRRAGVFPGGISFGTVQFVDGAFQTNGAKSTIEVVNLMLGQGNDTFQVLGTLDPDVAVKIIGSIILTPRAAGALGAAIRAAST